MKITVPEIMGAFDDLFYAFVFFCLPILIVIAGIASENHPLSWFGGALWLVSVWVTRDRRWDNFH